MQKYRNTLAVLILFVGVVKAQYDPMFTQYMFNEAFINPAYAGSKEAVSLTSLYRSQWVNIPGAPKTISFSAHAPLMNNKMGLSFSLLNDKIGVANRTMSFVGYAYRFKLSKGLFSLGLQAGMNSIEEKLSQLNTTTQGDQLFAANTPTVRTPNFGFGMYYYTGRFYTGLSIPRLVNNDIKLNANQQIEKKNKFQPDNFHYFFVAGYVFDVADDIKLKPQMMTKVVKNAPIEVDMNVNVLLKELLWLGISYRTKADISALVGYQVTPQLLINYSYDYSLTALQQYNSGSHEIAINYLFSYNKRKIASPRYF
ncbi:MAG: type IX secretion system membrane protein PorP/SprF [Bacteroidetes bacterium]|nr:type IX secretion system membrane protein PorP/SprF [Bacteroidota bacterium]